MNIGIDSLQVLFWERDNHDKINEIILPFSLKYILILESAGFPDIFIRNERRNGVKNVF